MAHIESLEEEHVCAGRSHGEVDNLGRLWPNDGLLPADRASGFLTLLLQRLERLGEDPQRHGLVRTPERTDKALRFLTSGYWMDVHRIINCALYEVKYDAMVVVKDIEVFSVCEYHMPPFFGRIHVAYLPRKKVIGLSKIPGIVDMFARRLQIQERLTQELAQTIQAVLDPLGVGVICDARRFCMMMRGVEKQQFQRDDQRHAGCFRERRKRRMKFLALANHEHNGH
jgi:GTP cyclohydrolase I